MDLMTALAAVSQSVGILRDLSQLDRSVDVAEYKAKVAEVTSTMADAKMALVDASEYIRGLEAEVLRLKKDSSRKSDLVEAYGHHYEKGTDGKSIGYPFCPVCLEDEVRLYRLAKTDGPRGSSYCPKCKAKFEVATFPYQPRE